MKNKASDLEQRLITHAVSVLAVAEMLSGTPAGNHIRGQILRSGTAAAPNYGEAQSAESRADFIHKMKVALKELRETRIWLLIIQQAGLVKPPTMLDDLVQETHELIAIFVSSTRTASQNSG